MPFRSNLKYAPAVREVPQQKLTDEDETKRSNVPDCPRCKIPMFWYESHLQRQNGHSKLIHSFACSQCGNTARIEEPYKTALRIVA